MKLTLGTRGSALAVGQSELVAAQLRTLGHTVELVRIRTGGDIERGSLTRLGTLGIFAAELRTAILDCRCDLAVHSLKDLPTTPVPGLAIAAIPARADARDALCARNGLTLDGLPAGAKVGTGSPRRVAQLRALRPDVTFVDIRGNVGTRLARVAEGDLDAVVLAAAGLRRLGLEAHITDLLDILPAPGQGALALECRADRLDLINALARIDDATTHDEVDAERSVLAGLGGGCAAPIGAWARDGVLRAGVFSLDGTAAAHAERPLGPGADDLVVADLLDAGAATVAQLDASRPSRLADLHDDTSLWGGARSLAGVRVLLPRADGALADGIRAAGAEVVAHPVQRKVLLRPGGGLDGADWVTLTSATTLDALEQLGLTIPESARVAAVGATTAAAAARRGIRVDLVPQGEASAAALVAAFPCGTGRVVAPGSALAKPTLAHGLSAKGWDVETLPVYTVVPLRELPDRLGEEWRGGHFDVVVVTSGSVGRAVGELLGYRRGIRVVAFGEPSAAALRELGVEPDALAATQDAAGVVEAIASLEE
ncbi:MAG: hydroxymethylbilane synthase [Tessaracoccus sp.]|uniref:hydroxymethylbilane synthase n=1 Tax=Tessaracoccus sp. TaxID=1971211 RepID=UPI001EB596A4|nr:hydroxymethylbilane synthase [Tessaracoccus sp.]MBK7820624.1 hydroxymethylbilane synthase [Tessaracoccus sp.]